MIARLIGPVLRPLLRAVGDFALPSRCPACGVPVAADGRFCAACWGELTFLGPPWCAACHKPFAFAAAPGTRCDECRRRPPRHDGVNAAVAYDRIARLLALRLKYGGKTGVARTMAARMAPLLPAAAELLVPVPLHRWRLWSRGYNQAGLIAAAVAARSGVPSHPDLLRRIRRTPVLRGMAGRARAAAVTGAFAVRLGVRPRIAGRHVVLVDDVHTSGATADACTDALLGAGAASVTVLCWARVLRGDD